MKIKLILAYDGTAYSGWQVQKNALTVQQVVQDAVERAFGNRYLLTGCSRTDSGVHANDFCCCLDTGEVAFSVPTEKIPLALNCFLPDDVAVLSAAYVDEGFHPRYDVKYKEYEYLIWNSPIRNVFLNRKALCYPKRLDEEVMNRAAQMFVGKYDFAGFMSSGSSVEDTVRNIKYFSVERSDDLISIKVAADGFLYNMVRILVGTLIEVSEGKIKVEDIPGIIGRKERKLAGFTAPPHGLYLNKVVY